MPNWNDPNAEYPLPAMDDSDLLPQTRPRPQEPPLPPRQPKPVKGKRGGGLLPRTSVRTYQPEESSIQAFDGLVEGLANKPRDE